jgi:hypothetical protein
MKNNITTIFLIILATIGAISLFNISLGWFFSSSLKSETKPLLDDKGRVACKIESYNDCYKLSNDIKEYSTKINELNEVDKRLLNHCRSLYLSNGNQSVSFLYSEEDNANNKFNCKFTNKKS